MLDQQPPGLGRQVSATAAAYQLRADLPLEEGDLPRHGGLGQLQGVARGRERAVHDDRPERGQLHHVIHNESLGFPCNMPMYRYGSAGYPRVMASTSDRLARTGTTVIFFLTGAVVAAWSTRIPAIQERLHLTPASLSVAILGLEAGAILGLPLGGALTSRLGSRRSLRAGLAVYPTALLGLAAAPGLAVLAMALAVMAAANSVVDVAMNAQGVELERRHGRPILSSMHAGHSAGLCAGGLAGTAAAAAAVPPLAHFAATAVVGVVAGLTATRWLVDEPGDRARPILARPDRPLMLLGALAFCGFLLDGAAYNWSAVHLRTAYHASPALAAAAFTAFTLALAV